MQKVELIEEDLKLIEELNAKLSNITKSELKYIFKKLKEKDISPDLIAWYALGYDSNYDIIVGYIYQQYGLEIPYPESQRETENKTQNEYQNIFNSDMGFWKEFINDVKSVAIIGDTGTGKTSLAHRIIGMVRVARKMPVYVFNHPKPELLKRLGWHNLESLELLKDLRNVCVYIDEPQEVMRFYENNGNPLLTRLLALARQRSIFLVLSTSVSQYVTRMLEGQIDVWCIKDCDVDSVKQGGRVSKIIKNACEFDKNGFKLKPKEYLFYCRRCSNVVNTKHTFELPVYWNDDYSKPYY